MSVFFSATPTLFPTGVVRSFQNVTKFFSVNASVRASRNASAIVCTLTNSQNISQFSTGTARIVTINNVR